MSRDHVDHKDIVQFAEKQVNLPRDKSEKYRGQARRLREKLETYLKEHPDFSLKKMLISGSLAKGTALRSLNDIDISCYITGVDAPTDVKELIDFLVEKLQSVFPNFTSDQVTAQTYSVTVSFRGSGLNVDIVPILYNDDSNWYGNLVSQDDGSFLKTSIPRHLEFIKTRKNRHEKDFAQVVRLVKFWAKKMKAENENFRFKSFMIELILAHLSDKGMDFSDYPEALQHFFTFIAKTNMKEKIIFNDFYNSSDVGSFWNPVQIIDPVNAENNVSKLYTDYHANIIVEAALDAGDAIDAALSAPTKGETFRYWQKIFGQTFQP